MCFVPFYLFIYLFIFLTDCAYACYIILNYIRNSEGEKWYTGYLKLPYNCLNIITIQLLQLRNSCKQCSVNGIARSQIFFETVAIKAEKIFMTSFSHSVCVQRLVNIFWILYAHLNLLIVFRTEKSVHTRIGSCSENSDTFLSNRQTFLKIVF